MTGGVDQGTGAGIGIGGQIGGGADAGTGGEPGAGGGGAAGGPYGAGGNQAVGPITPGPTDWKNSAELPMVIRSRTKSNWPVLLKSAFGTGGT